MSKWPTKGNDKMTTFGQLTRSQLMSRVRSTGNKTTEVQLMSLLRKSGLKGWRRHLNLLGKPDFTWPKEKLAVFVDGCFWHGHDCGKNINPKTNSQAWQDKISNNKKRDRRVTNILRKKGWSVIRIWECNLKKSPIACLKRIQCKIVARSS